MKIPNAERAIVPRPKLVNYLLSETHASGHSKAKFFRANGFDESNITMLERELLKIARESEVAEVEEGKHGVKYIIRGRIATPNGRRVDLLTVWIIEEDISVPRFVTAYPD